MARVASTSVNERPGLHLPQPVPIVERTDESADTFTIALDTTPLPPEARGFEPGQFCMLYVPGHGEAAISLSGDPGREDRFVHTIRRVGRVTDALAALRVGDAVGLRGPFGRGWPLETARGGDVLIVAGGLGLAPLRPLVHAVVRHRDAFGRVLLVIGAREPRALLYPDAYRVWREAGLAVEVTVDRAGPGWSGHVGVVTPLVAAAPIEPARCTAFVCGPEIMMRFVAREARARGIAPQRIFVSLERNMRCALGHCGHCMLGPHFVCRDGPVLPVSRLEGLWEVREL